MIGNDAFQEADIVGISRSITKHNYLVTDRKDLGRVMREAFYIATSGRPGPVLVDIPKDVLLESSEEPLPESVSHPRIQPRLQGPPHADPQGRARLAKAKRPLFYVGGGLHISGAAEVFRSVVAKVNVPTISSLMGISVLPSSHPRFLGMLGMHGTYAANMAVQNCDLLFAVGTRFDDRATGEISKFAPHAAVVHVDIDPASISRNVAVEVPIVGDARLVLEELLPQLEAPVDRRVGADDRRVESRAIPPTEIPQPRGSRPRGSSGLSPRRFPRPS